MYINRSFNLVPPTILTSVGICPPASERTKRISKDDWNEWYSKKAMSVIREQMHLHNIPVTPLL